MNGGNTLTHAADAALAGRPQTLLWRALATYFSSAGDDWQACKTWCQGRGLVCTLHTTMEDRGREVVWVTISKR